MQDTCHNCTPIPIHCTNSIIKWPRSLWVLIHVAQWIRRSWVLFTSGTQILLCPILMACLYMYCNHIFHTNKRHAIHAGAMSRILALQAVWITVNTRLRTREPCCRPSLYWFISQSFIKLHVSETSQRLTSHFCVCCHVCQTTPFAACQVPINDVFFVQNIALSYSVRYDTTNRLTSTNTKIAFVSKCLFIAFS